MIRIMAKGNSTEQLLLENKAVAEKEMRGGRVMAFHLSSFPLWGYGFSNCVYAFIWFKIITTLRGLWGLGLGSTRWSSVRVSPHICEPGWEKRADTSSSSSLQLPGKEGDWPHILRRLISVAPGLRPPFVPESQRLDRGLYRAFPSQRHWRGWDSFTHATCLMLGAHASLWLWCYDIICFVIFTHD